MLALHPKHEASMACPAGYQYYTCAISSFRGCCSVDPCKQSSACPLENQPAFSMSPESTTSIITSAFSESTSQPLSTTRPSTVSASETVTSATTTSTNANTTLAGQDASTPSRASHANLIAGLLTGLLAALILISVILFYLWRHRQVKKDRGDEAMSLPRLSRTKTYRTSQTNSEGRVLWGPPGITNEMAPPTSAMPSRRSFPQATSGRTGDNNDNAADERSPTDATPRQPSIRRVQFTPSPLSFAGDHPPGAWPPSVSSRGAGNDTASLVHSSLNSSPRRRRDSELDTTWVNSEFEHNGLGSPFEFHGLSAPPRSRGGSSHGSRGNQAG